GGAGPHVGAGGAHRRHPRAAARRHHRHRLRAAPRRGSGRRARGGVPRPHPAGDGGMSNVLTIARRDLGAYLLGYTAYVIIAGILFIEGLMFNAFAMGAESARYSHEVLEDFFYINGGAAMIASVLLTMRSLAEEQATGTDVLLRTSVA